MEIEEIIKNVKERIDELHAEFDADPELDGKEANSLSFREFLNLTASLDVLAFNSHNMA